MTLAARLAWTLSTAGLFAALPQTALAGDETRVKADVTTEGGYTSNPFSQLGSHLGSAYLQIEARPEAKLIAERSVITLKGDLRYQYYFRNYSDTADYQGTLDYRGTPSSRLTTHASATYNSQIIGGIGFFNSLIDPTQPPPPINTGTDLTFFGTVQRQRSLDFAGDVAYVLNSRDSLTANGFYDIARYGGKLAEANYDGYGGGTGYSRKMSEHLQLGVQASAAQYLYQALLGRSQVYSLQATATDQFSSRWKLTGALGASYSTRSTGGSSVYPTGNVELCRATMRTSLCASVDESVQPTGTGTAASTVGHLSYSYRVSERSTLYISGNYLHESARHGILRSGSTAGLFSTNRAGISTYGGMASFDHALGRRVHFIATTQYRLISGGNAHFPDDFNGSLGISVRFGDPR